MAITIGILFEIVLMILFCRVEVLQRQFLYGQRLLVVLLLFGKDLLNDGQIRRVGIVEGNINLVPIFYVKCLDIRIAKCKWFPTL